MFKMFLQLLQYIAEKTAPTADMPVAKATAAEATVTAPKYPSGISVEKTLEKIKLWGKGAEEGGCRDLIRYLGMGIVQLCTCTFCVLQVHAV